MKRTRSRPPTRFLGFLGSEGISGLIVLTAFWEDADAWLKIIATVCFVMITLGFLGCYLLPVLSDFLDRKAERRKNKAIEEIFLKKWGNLPEEKVAKQYLKFLESKKQWNEEHPTVEVEISQEDIPGKVLRPKFSRKNQKYK